MIYYTIPNSAALATGIGVMRALVPPGTRHNFAFVFKHLPGKPGHLSVSPDSKAEVTKCGYGRRYIYVLMSGLN
jgi:hypothetical protein